MTANRCEAGEESGTIKSARRVLQILELFRHEDRALSTTDVAQALGYPISSTAALLKSLLALGYLLFDRHQRTYRASIRMGLLGCPTGHWGARVAAATERLAEFSDMLGMAVAVGVRNGNDIQYVQRFDPSAGRVDYGTPAGSVQRLVDTPMGRTLLALDDDRAIDRLVRMFNASRSTEALIDGARLLAEVRSIRDAGLYYSTDSIHSGFAIAATNIQAANGQWLVIGIGNSAALPGSDRASMTNALQQIADAVIAQMAASNRPAPVSIPTDAIVPHEGELMAAQA